MEKDRLPECLLKEVEIVQDIISRMANNQFYIKGWALTLVIGALILQGNFYQSLLAFVPWLIFWVYDSYFMRLEKLYRAHYEWLIQNRLKSDELLFDLDRVRVEAKLKENLKGLFQQKVPGLTKIMFTKSLLPFYLFLLVMILTTILVEYLQKGKLI